MKKLNLLFVSILLFIILAITVYASPVVNLISPEHGNIDTDGNVTFMCNASDTTNLKNSTFYIWGPTNLSHSFEIDGLQSSLNWTTNLSNGNYEWNCFFFNNQSQSSWAPSNYTLNVDVQTPIITTLVAPPHASTITTANVTVNFSTNIDAVCIVQLWNHTGGGGGVNVSISENISCNTTANYTLTNLPDREYLWSARCHDVDNESNYDWAIENTFILDAIPPLDITLLYPTNGAIVQSNFFEFNYSVNETANCTFYWNFSMGEAGNWGSEGLFQEVIADEENNFVDMMAPNIGILWNVMCYDSNSDTSWATSNYTFTINGSMPDCFGLNVTTCVSTANCTWEDFAGGCFYDCIQYDADEGGNQSQCEAAYGGELCEWFSEGEICDPVVLDKGFEGFSFCFNYDGNQTGCDNFSDDCIWFSEPGCTVNEPCYDSTNSNHGWCDPTGFNFGDDFDCWTYDGNETGCFYSMDTLGWPCQWNPDPWGPLIAGNNSGWCNMMMGGGSSGGGCWDAFDEDSCNATAAMGMPCVWQSGISDGWCEPQGCWDYWTQGDCNTHANEGCLWDSQYMYCYEVGCWDIYNATGCGTANTTYGLDCVWHNISFGNGWCEEEGCWLRDWTNETYCEEKEGCVWENNWCNQQGCWNFDMEGETNCTNNTYTGLNCQWETGSWSYCEQQGCWSYNGNQSGCENDSADYGLSCQWNSDNNDCYDVIGGCTDYNNDEFGCYNTFWCNWNVSNNTCIEPDTSPMQFINPDCWIFDQAGEAACDNITACNWTGSACENNGVGPNGIQCVDINHSQMCNNLPMLSTCCMWNGTGCEDAQFTTSCWDNMQDPPDGAYFCEDYNSINSQQICNQIAGDPWYMSCSWDNVSEQCMFAYDNYDPGMGYGDLTEANCDDAGGNWIVNTWIDENGVTHFDEWCEIGFGYGTQTCAETCWACEYQDNQSDWDSNSSARSACEQSTAGCVFFEDSYAFNGFGWCDMNWQYQGNCEGNCFDCWETDMCTDSAAGCTWLTDSWNNASWCQDENALTCSDDCYLCWDQDNCVNSDADCTWDTNYWYCNPSGSGSGSSYEVCFDGIDNDADDFVDCADSECTFDSFCGGAGVFGSDCPSIPNNNTCINETGCVWITDQWNNSWCDMEGAQCWMFDDNETACDTETGCNFKSMEEMNITNDFCDINFSIMENSSCWNYWNSSECNTHYDNGCIWMEDQWCNSPEGQNDSWCQANPGAGWCDHEIWSCHTHDDNETACNSDNNCGWNVDWFNPDWGWCDPICFSRNNNTCEDPVNGTTGVCELRNASEMAWCEPDNMFTGCWDHFTEVDCNTSNTTCTWVIDPMMPNGGFCGDLFMQGMIGNMDPSPPLIIANENCTSGSYEESDICYLGVKDSPENFGLGTGVYSMNEAAICSDKFTEFSGSTPTKYYWYLDSNGNTSGGCTPDDNTSLTGFDLKFKLEASIVSDGLIETKVAYKCIGGNWSPSMIRTTSWPDKMCYMVIGGVMAVDKEDLISLSVLDLYDETADMRIYATTAIENGSSDNTYDTIGPAWYSPGAADFMFEDCVGFVDADGDGLLPDDDPDCDDFLRYGYIDIETGSQCNDNIDNDGNGDIDCNDTGCMYDAYFCNIDDITDYSAPTITWFEVEEFNNGAFVGIDTNEPTNATLYFHKNDSYCSNVSNAIVINDSKLSNAFTDDDYDFWHDFFVDQFYFSENNISYTIEETSTYYFKLRMCDNSGNCAVSACTNFTTTNQTTDYVIGFELPPPESDITTYLGKVVVLFDLDGDGNFDDTIEGSNGILVNDTVGRDVNIRFTNLNATDTWSVDFIGADLLKALTLNISDTFIVNDTAEGDALVGMDSDKWVELAQRLGVDYVRIQIPVGLPAGTDGQLIHCPDNVTDLEDDDCVELDMTDINCTFNTNSTICYIPTSIGFSVFGVTEEDDSSGGDDPGGDGGSSGGGGAGEPSLWNRTYTVDDAGFEAGYTRLLALDERIRVSINDEDHHVGIVAITSTTATINVSSTTQQQTLSVGNLYKFDVTDDDYYDISVLLNNIYNESANLTVKYLHELMPEPEEYTQTPGVIDGESEDLVDEGLVDEQGQDKEQEQKEETIPQKIIRKLSTLSLFVVILILIFIALALAIIFSSWKKHHKDNPNNK